LFYSKENFFYFIKETYDKQMYLLINENEKFKQNFHQTERIVVQLRRENEELQQKVKINLYI